MGAKKKKSTTRSDTSLESLDLYTFFLDRASESKTLRKALQAIGARVEIHREFYQPDADDQLWLPEVAAKGWVIISQDQFNELEREAIRNAGGRAFLVVHGSATGEEQAAIVTGAMRRMLRMLKAVPAPFIARIYRANRVLLIPKEK
jgi:PIN like domain